MLMYPMYPIRVFSIKLSHVGITWGVYRNEPQSGTSGVVVRMFDTNGIAHHQHNSDLESDVLVGT